MLRVLLPLFVGMGWMVLETSFVGFLPARFPSPDVVLVVAIIFGFGLSPALGGGFSFLLGLVQDVLAGGVIGLNALSKTVVFSLTKVMARRFYFPGMTSKMGMVFLGAVVDGFLVAVVLLIGGGMHIYFPSLFQYLLLQILCTGLLAPVILIITAKLLDLGEGIKGGIFCHALKKARTRGISTKV